jgi:serine/threonine-protein kinase
MGFVYRARDRRLGRMVAIKVLAPKKGADADALARFRREAETASSLNHPSIVTIYDIGETAESGLFIAMELIDGTNLREWSRIPHPNEQRIDILLQVASGLAAAHARGILHRDVKPENIMVSSAGFAKVVDFGLAKSVEAMSIDGSTDVMVTGHGRVVGTLAYMSPEQLAGEPLDARSDIFSFGCVIRDVFIANRPGSLTPVVERCLQKDRSLRYQSMDELTRDLRGAMQGRMTPVLRRLALGVAAAIIILAAILISRRSLPIVAKAKSASIAVLPFRVVGGNGESYLADGISDGLTTDLAKQSGLTVIARNSARRFGADADLVKVGKELGVRYVLLGSVQRNPKNLRVDAQLIDTATNAHVWADHYDPSISNIFSAEDAIVRAIAGKIAPQPLHSVMKQPSDPRVADLYLRARFFSEDRSWSTQDRSIPILEEVVRLDPNFLPARITLAQQYHRKAFEPDPDRKWEEKSFIELQKILAQDPSSAEAFTIRGNLNWILAHHFPHEQALADFNRAIQLDPNLVSAYNSRGAVLMHVGLLDDALADFRTAQRLDPFNDFAGYRIARIHLYQQKCSEAASEFKKSWPGDFQYPIALECSGQHQAAIAALSSQTGNPADTASTAAVILAKEGRGQEAKDAIQRAIANDDGGSHYHHAEYLIAAAYAQLRDVGNTLKWLERTSRDGMPCYPLFAADHLLDPVRSDPGMQKFLDDSRREWQERRRQRGL